MSQRVCMECNTYYTASLDACPNCSTSAEDSVMDYELEQEIANDAPPVRPNDSDNAGRWKSYAKALYDWARVPPEARPSYDTLTKAELIEAYGKPVNLDELKP
jgi:hypothetical protein